MNIPPEIRAPRLRRGTKVKSWLSGLGNAHLDRNGRTAQLSTAQLQPYGGHAFSQAERDNVQVGVLNIQCRQIADLATLADGAWSDVPFEAESFRVLKAALASYTTMLRHTSSSLTSGAEVSESTERSIEVLFEEAEQTIQKARDLYTTYRDMSSRIDQDQWLEMEGKIELQEIVRKIDEDIVKANNVYLASQSIEDQILKFFESSKTESIDSFEAYEDITEVSHWARIENKLINFGVAEDSLNEHKKEWQTKMQAIIKKGINYELAIRQRRSAERTTMEAFEEDPSTDAMIAIQAETLKEKRLDLSRSKAFGLLLSTALGFRRPIVEAALLGDINSVQYLISKRVDVNTTDVHGWTALHWAVHNRYNEIAKILIKGGADCNKTTLGGQTALYLASMYGNVTIARVLLEHRADATTPTDLGLTAMHEAAYFGSVEFIQLLEQHGADLDTRDNDRRTPFMTTCFSGTAKAASYLRSKGVDLKSPDKYGFDALAIAAEKGFVSILKVIHESDDQQRPDFHRRDSQGWTVLDTAVGFQRAEVVRFLLNAIHLNANNVDNHGRSTLLLAACYGSPDIINMLIAERAIVNAKCGPHEQTALHGAANYGRAQAAETLLNHFAIESSKTKHGFTPLHFAVSQGHISVVKVLLRRQAPVNASSRTAWTPLHMAAAEGFPTIAELLLQNNADIDARTDSTLTPLQVAANYGRHDVVRLLLLWGASAYDLDLKGRTVAQVARARGFYDLADLLDEYTGGTRRKPFTMDDRTAEGYQDLSSYDSFEEREQALLRSLYASANPKASIFVRLFGAVTRYSTVIGISGILGLSALMIHRYAGAVKSVANSVVQALSGS